jgi:phage FluMu gp28-like protein
MESIKQVLDTLKDKKSNSISILDISGDAKRKPKSKKKLKKIKKKASVEDNKKYIRKKYRQKEEVVATESPKTEVSKEPIPSTPLIVVKKDLVDNMDDSKVKEWLSTIDGLIEGLTKVHETPTHLYDYQIAHCRNKSKFRSIKKSRQTGFSFIFSAEALAKAHLCNINTSIFISYNHEEASEKILCVKMLYESMPLEYQKKRVTDNKHSQIFKNSRGNLTRIISTAQRPPRGKGHNTDVYLDEFAFYMFADKIFTASAPVVTRGTGVLTMGSTPFGARGKFWEVNEHPNEYPQFSRQNVPWWHCPDLCIDVKTAFKLGSSINTHERVDRFGTSPIKVIYDSMPIDDFQQEYELAFIDENVSYFPIQVVNACCYVSEKEDFSYDEIIDGKTSELNLRIDSKEKSLIESKYPSVKFFKCESIEELSFKINSGDIRYSLYAGYDVGRRKDKSEFVLIEEIPISANSFLHVVRFTHQLDRVKFSDQEDFLTKIMKFIPIQMMAMDATGLGMNLSENMETKFPGRIDAIQMSSEWKDKSAQNMKIRFESQTIAVPDDDKLKRQIGSIKRKVSDSGGVRYDAEKDKEHHGDKFWALTLASNCGIEPSKLTGSIEVVGASERSLAQFVKIINPYGHMDEGYKNELGLEQAPRMFAGSEAFGLGQIPNPIGNLLSPGTYIDSGRDPWSQPSNVFHMLNRKK